MFHYHPSISCLTFLKARRYRVKALVDLTDSTIEANSRFFASRDQVPTKAISMGIASIMAAKKIILFAYGDKKSDAIFKMVKGPVTEEVPASVLQNHPDVTLILDEAAAAKL